MDWIAAGRSGPGLVSACVPPVFPAYAKLFHAMAESDAAPDAGPSWDQAEKSALPPVPAGDSLPSLLMAAVRDSTLIYGGRPAEGPLRRLRWASLAARLGLAYEPRLSSWSFTRCFPGGSWPASLVGPREGCLLPEEIAALLPILRRHTAPGPCLFHLWCLATADWGADRLFEGELAEVSAFPDQVPGARLTPTHVFPADRSWLLCTDYDLSFTLIGGPEALVHDLMASEELECLAVTPGMRVDRDADLPASGMAG